MAAGAREFGDSWYPNGHLATAMRGLWRGLCALQLRQAIVRRELSAGPVLTFLTFNSAKALPRFEQCQVPLFR